MPRVFDVARGVDDLPQVGWVGFMNVEKMGHDIAFG
jgi:hypothetical protein